MKIIATLKNLLGKIIKHKFISAVIVIALIAGGYFVFSSLGGSTSQTKYVLAAAEKGQLVTTVSGSGQVSASKQVDIKATVSGDVLSVNAKVGDEVKKGKLIAQLDSTTAQKSVRDAEISLETAQLALESLNGFNAPRASAGIRKSYVAVTGTARRIAPMAGEGTAGRPPSHPGL